MFGKLKKNDNHGGINVVTQQIIDFHKTYQIALKCISSVQFSVLLQTIFRGTQREYSSKALKHSIVERILVFKR